MNIHDHQAKQILKQFGVAVPEGVFGFTVEELLEKCKSLKTDKYVLKSQIHAGGRGKAGGVKISDNLKELDLQICDQNQNVRTNCFVGFHLQCKSIVGAGNQNYLYQNKYLLFLQS